MFGIVGVVVVFVAVLSIAEGLNAAMQAAGDPDLVLVLRAGSDTEMTSGFYSSTSTPIAGRAGRRARRRRGAGVAGAARRSSTCRCGATASTRNVPLRGVLPVAFKVHGRLKIVAGRNFTPGRNEVIVGRAALRQYAGLDLGSTMQWGENTWTWSASSRKTSSVAEGEIWCDVRVAQPVYHRNNLPVGERRARVAGLVPALKDALTTDPRLTVIGDAAVGLLRRAVARRCSDHPQHRLRDHRIDGRRRDLRAR